MGVRIFTLCLRQLLVNWKTAIRLSWLLVLVIVAVYVVFLTIFGAPILNTTDDGGQDGTRSVSIFIFLVAWLGLFSVFLLGPASIAVGWHRYGLRGEIPANPYLFPPQRLIWPYVWRGIKLGLKLLAVAIPIGFSLSFIMALFFHNTAMLPSGAVPFSFFVASTIVNLLFTTLFLWVFFRIGLGLPGVAVGQDMRSGASWNLTQSVSEALFTTAFLVAVLQTIPALLAYLLELIFPTQQGGIVENMPSGSALFWDLLPIPIYLAFSIINFFVGFGVLTVIYGHLQEDKPI